MRGSVVLVEVGKLPRRTGKLKKLWLLVERAGRDKPRPHLARVLPQVRSRTHDPLQKQTLGWTASGFRCPEQTDRWT